MNLKVNLGTPLEQVLVEGHPVQVRDDLGLSLDPRAHAKRSCKTCHGKGVYVVSRVGPRTTTSAEGTSEVAWGLQPKMATCSCAVKGYARNRAAVSQP